jgi:hypothetical protein
MSKITLASSAEVWLINLPGEPFTHFYSNDMEGLGSKGIQEVFLASYEDMRAQTRIIGEDENSSREEVEVVESFPVTRSRRSPPSQLQVAQTSMSPESQSIHTPAGNTIVSGDRHSEEQGMSSVAPLHENGTIRWTNVPRQPIPPLDDVSLWVGHQLNHKRIPKEYRYMPPDGELMVSLEGYPEGAVGHSK